MDVQLKPGYMLQLSKEELRIVGLALSGKLWEDKTGRGQGPKLVQQEDRQKALEMNRQLVAALAMRSTEQVKHWEKISQEINEGGSLAQEMLDAEREEP